ncbi:hypothetical protein PENNAL_c0245G06469 [Penicillium nalgiovense]|uniref:Uncharacterized protein n=1 Tax=Penicillium nalgiovense TaxID=60175 RepID=A0A1V6WK29_PENNA|nr:hypothetical protein PENNAL_c0245G06469 [Penicillium nalgiovense]
MVAPRSRGLPHDLPVPVPPHRHSCRGTRDIS